MIHNSNDDKEKTKTDNVLKPTAEEAEELLSEDELEGVQGGITTILPPKK